VEVIEEGHDLVTGLGVQVSGGLVGEDDRRLGDDRPGDGRSLLLAARKLRRDVATAVGKTDRVDCSERAAAPKAVVIRDSLPLTPVGKPYKLPLRADATRRAVVDALSALPGRIVVNTVEEGGSVMVILAAPGVDPAEIERALAGYAIAWRLESNRP